MQHVKPFWRRLGALCGQNTPKLDVRGALVHLILYSRGLRVRFFKECLWDLCVMNA